MDGWMDRQTDRGVEEKLHSQTDGWTEGHMAVQTEGHPAFPKKRQKKSVIQGQYMVSGKLALPIFLKVF